MTIQETAKLLAVGSTESVFTSPISNRFHFVRDIGNRLIPAGNPVRKSRLAYQIRGPIGHHSKVNEPHDRFARIFSTSIVKKQSKLKLSINATMYRTIEPPFIDPGVLIRRQEKTQILKSKSSIRLAKPTASRLSSPTLKSP